MSDGATKVRYKPLHQSLDFGNFGLAGKLARTARRQGIKDAKPKIAVHVAKNAFYRAVNPMLERMNLTGLTRYKSRRMSRLNYLFETKMLGGLSNINSASMIEANAVRGQGTNEEVVGGGCHVPGRRESVGVVQSHLGNPMGRIKPKQSFSGNDLQNEFPEAPRPAATARAVMMSPDDVRTYTTPQSANTDSMKHIPEAAAA